MGKKIKEKIESVRARVMDAIESGNVDMHSRLYFATRSVLWAVAGVLALGVLLYLASLVVFVTRGGGIGLLPYFGKHGWMLFVGSLPWLLILGVLVLFALLQVLGTHFSFVYKRPLVYSILGGVVVLVAGGALFLQTPVHERAFEMSREGRLPIAGGMYRNVGADTDDVRIGVVLSVGENTLEIRSAGRKIYTVRITDDTRMPPVAFTVDMKVLVVGEEDDGVIDAIGIHPAPDVVPPPPIDATGTPGRIPQGIPRSMR